MKTNASMMIRSVLTAFLLVFAISLPLDAATKIKPVVVIGDPAPEGGTFTFIGGSFSMNNPGVIAFSASTTNSGGIYLASDLGSNTTIQKAVKPGDTVIIPTCTPVERPVRGFVDPLIINDAGAIIFHESSFTGIPVLFSGGVLTLLDGCPSELQLLLDLTQGKFRFLLQKRAFAMNNAGTVALQYFLIEDTFTFRQFLFSGGTLTHFPGGGILDINDSGSLLVSSSQGIFLDSTPVASIGGPTGDGRTFRSISSITMNNAREVVFAAFLSDFRRAIFHWADGILTPLVRENDPIPGGGTFWKFFDVKINDNGDIIFSGSAFGAPGGIFMLKANGGLSRVVGQGDSVPGVGTLANIGSLQFNNKGQIAFLGFLSNGKNGIFLAGAGLETEFVDPVPDLLMGSTIPFDPPKLATDGRKVTGIAADGAAQVIVRVKTGQTGNVEFSLVDEGGAALPASNMNGFLGQVGSPPVSSTVSVQAQDVTGVGPMAFAAFRAPVDFSSGPDSVEAGLPDRQVFIKIKLTTSTGETVESTESLKIVRPPVVLVHGLWGSPEAWDAFSPLNGNSMFWVNLADYEDSHARALSFNMPLIALQTKAAVQDFKLTRQVAAIQADVVTHSMGGLLTRMLPLLDDIFFRDDNFGHGDVHKLINIDTPHLGTPFARFLQLSPCVSRFFDSHDRPTDQGAVGDLIPGSRALREINSAPSSVELHNIVGLTGIAGIELTEGSPIYLWLRLRCRRDFRGIPVNGFFDAVLGTPDHDLIVPGVSQQGRATTNITTVVGVIHTQVEFFFQGVGVLESPDASNRAVNLLNTPINSLEFDTFVGFP